MPDEDATCRADFQLAPAFDQEDDCPRPMSRARLDALIAETNALITERAARPATEPPMVAPNEPPIEAKAMPAAAPIPAYVDVAREWQARHGNAKPDPASVQPGQDDAALEAYLSGWMTANRRKRLAAERCYAGALGATSPRIEDFARREDQIAAYDAWLGRCTPRQRAILDAASAARKERDRLANNAASATEMRARYATRAAEEGRAVRTYVKHKTDEERAEARKQQYRESKSRLRAAETPEQAAERRAKDAEAKRYARQMRKIVADLGA